MSASTVAVSDQATATLGGRPSFSGHARLSGVVLKPVTAMTTPHGHLPPIGTFSTRKTSAATIKRLTECEMFRNLEAEAKASGTSKAKKKRTSAGRPQYASGDMDYTEDEDEEPHVRKRMG
ncbi:hypothetical protein LTR85_007494 [Meristemomyces frigidus]|nr:hypothetical protein LTR85_007494 [Meristemomyces frigidus]